MGYAIYYGGLWFILQRYQYLDHAAPNDSMTDERIEKYCDEYVHCWATAQ
jgi:hypothetical protein